MLKTYILDVIILILMKDEIPVLHCKLKRYERKSKQKSKDGEEQVNRRYMIPVKKDQIEGTKFQDVENLIILSRDDYEYELQKSKVMNLSHEKLKLSLKDKEQQIKDFNNENNEKNHNDDNLEDLEDKLNDDFQSKLNIIVDEYKGEIETLNEKMEELNRIKRSYDNLDAYNKELERELKRLRDLRTLEKEAHKIKLQEIELDTDEYKQLKKSHELLWDVVQEKDKLIKDFEKKGLVGNLINKIKK